MTPTIHAGWSAGADGLIRPAPLPVRPTPSVASNAELAAVTAALIRGEDVVVADRFATGLAVLANLKKALSPSAKQKSYADDRRFRSAYREASHRLLVPIENGAIALHKAPAIGWLERLFSDVAEFRLPFPQVQGLNSSWQWYTKGIRFGVLEHPIHPFYATYFPTRFEHLELFETWLSTYAGSLQSTVDVGTGCGVLTFQLLRHRAADIWATDTNPNALQSVREDLERTKQTARVRLAEGDLFAGFVGQADLIVINPPWLPGDAATPIDTAIYYREDFFGRFFEAAAERVSPTGRVVVLFSNLSSQTHADMRHPIDAELDNGRFVEVSRLAGVVAPASKKTKRSGGTRRLESVELRELALAHRLVI